ncbi:MAG: tRNA 4-thiouridine(8) synthase ThiI [Chloroflexi bacterium]|nr:tRNA 4-thiouridine(8) synthase ThiI [Chloroflexota bacterium]
MDRYVYVSVSPDVALKGQNRPFFTRLVFANLERALDGLAVEVIHRYPLALLLRLPQGDLWPEVEERLRRVCGVVKFHPASRVRLDLEEMKAAAVQELNGRTFSSFRVNTRRGDKAFPLTSVQVNERLGGMLKERFHARVDLEHADVTVFVHILPREAFVYTEEVDGLGGLPIGATGKMVCLLSGGLDSPVAAWRMMKRGVKVEFVHFHSFPLVEGTSREKARELVELLTRYQYTSKLYLVPFAEIQKQVILSVPPRYRVVVYRRFMFRIAEAIARRERAKGLITGESLGQVSSQTLENMVTIGAACQMPVFRPLVSMDKEEIVREARRLGTYPISIIPDQDCCSLFVPKHPATETSQSEIEVLEKALTVEALVEQGVGGAQLEKFRWP